MSREVALPDRLPIPVVDNHTHLDIARDGEAVDVGAALAAAASVGVNRVVQIGCDLAAARETVAWVQRYAGMLGGVAIHPNEAPRLAARDALSEAYAEIAALAAHPRIRVVGETGLDYFRTGADGVAAQQDSFRWHIDLAKRLGKVLQVHDRDSDDDVLRILDEEGAPEHVVMHCFSGDANFARACLDRGFHLSFAGTITFKNTHPLRDALAVTPLDRVLVETDAPYLTPQPFRGATNSPALLPYTVRVMAGILGVSVPELCTQIGATSERLYGPW